MKPRQLVQCGRFMKRTVPYAANHAEQGYEKNSVDFTTRSFSGKGRAARQCARAGQGARQCRPSGLRQAD
jgi:hypothetical protein